MRPQPVCGRGNVAGEEGYVIDIVPIGLIHFFGIYYCLYLFIITVSCVLGGGWAMGIKKLGRVMKQ